MSTAVAAVGSAANQYQLLGRLAVGGMAEIFLARAVGVGGVARYVVVKKALRERTLDPHFVQMFLEEAQLASQLNHPNIAQVLDVGQMGDSYFFTMEYVHGENVLALLRKLREQGRDVPLPLVLTIIAQAAAGLHHAHERTGVDGRPLGIVHRDVSPVNLMITFEGSVKVLDFGVAKADTRTTETRTGAVKGKITYLSPEQARGFDVDRRTDLFALGICMWELLTREKLFNGQSDFENMSAIVYTPSPPPSQYRPHLAPEIDAVVARLLAKNPDERYQTAAELIEEIEALAARYGTPLSPIALGTFMREVFGDKPEPWLAFDGDNVETIRLDRGEAAQLLAQLPASALSPPIPPAPRWSRAGVVLGAAVAITLGVAAAFVIGRSRDTTTTPAPPDPRAFERDRAAGSDAAAGPSADAVRKTSTDASGTSADTAPRTSADTAPSASTDTASGTTADTSLGAGVPLGIDADPIEDAGPIDNAASAPVIDAAPTRTKRPPRRPPRRPPAKPAKDCTQDPFACQH